MQLKEYVVSFVTSYRSEADKLHESEKAAFGEYVEEYVLARPCQVEAIEFNDPYRLVWIFLLDKNKPDLMISVHKHKWKNVSVLVAEFGAKYSKMQLDLRRIYKILQRFRDTDTDNLNYSVDVLENAYLMCFPHDVRLGTWPLSIALNGDSSPKAVAEMVFYLNYSQSRNRY